MILVCNKTSRPAFTKSGTVILPGEIRACKNEEDVQKLIDKGIVSVKADLSEVIPSATPTPPPVVRVVITEPLAEPAPPQQIDTPNEEDISNEASGNDIQLPPNEEVSDTIKPKRVRKKPSTTKE